MNNLSRIGWAVVCLAVALTAPAREFHVAINGNNTNSGTESAPLRTIQRAAELAQPGDVITVHEGVYRERINPPHGGTSERKRIVYQAAPGEKVEIKGSEVIKGWTEVQDDTWQVTLPNSFFGGFNPYCDLIRGDWFDPKNRQHHTGAVYLNGDWLTEAVTLDEVLKPAGAVPAWLGNPGEGYLLNVVWLQPGADAGNAGRIPATAFTSKRGTQNAASGEGDECIGFISQGDWVRYERVDFGVDCKRMTICAASATDGGIIELRLNSPTGELLGTCAVTNTGGWQNWTPFTVNLKPVSGAKPLCLSFKSRKPPVANPTLNPQLWFAQVNATNTTIWAQFKGANPNEQLVEINARQTVFYPDQPGRNFITVRSFTMRHAATPWAPPTAEQIGLIGTHWSKGWIIESNIVSHSICSGISLGKHGDKFDNTSADTAEGYVKTIERAHAHPIAWTKENIGHHIVRNNTVSYCEQAGIVGSLGCAFSTVTGNTVHDIHVRNLFSGAEQAGIKFHGAIDTEISRNHIYRTTRGLWLDWMAQGTRVSQNLFRDNGSDDLFVEVNHGPFVVDHNLFLSAVNLQDWSQGGAYLHNLFAGKIKNWAERGRYTPFHPAHSTTVAGLTNILSGDDRFFNNVFYGAAGLSSYDGLGFPLLTGGNVYCSGARPYAKEADALVVAEMVTAPLWEEESGRLRLRFHLPATAAQATTRMVTTESLGRARVPNLPYENADGTPLKVDTDFFGRRRDSTPTTGPFENPGPGPIPLTEPSGNLINVKVSGGN